MISLFSFFEIFYELFQLLKYLSHRFHSPHHHGQQFLKDALEKSDIHSIPRRGARNERAKVENFQNYKYHAINHRYPFFASPSSTLELALLNRITHNFSLFLRAVTLVIPFFFCFLLPRFTLIRQFY